MARLTAIEHFQRWAEKHNADVDFANAYGEPGYTDPGEGKCIIMANWNDVPRGLADCLEEEGHEVEYKDEWTAIYRDGNSFAYRTSPDSYFWESRLFYADGEEYAPDGAAEWIEACKTSTHIEITPVPSFIHREDIEAEGWRAIEPELECGFHPGQTDNPQEIVRELLKKHSEVLLQRSERSQFYSKYLVYVPVDEESEQ